MDQPQPATDAQRQQRPTSADRPLCRFVVWRRLGWALGLSLLAALAAGLGGLPLLLTEQCGPEPDPLAEAKPEPDDEPEPPRKQTRRRAPVDGIEVHRLSFSSDGRLLMAEYGCRPVDPEKEDSVKRLTVWEVKTGREVWSLRVPPQNPRNALWVPGTHHFLLTQWDGRVSLWDADRGPPRRGKRPLFVFGEPSEYGNAPVAVSLDGRRALVASPEGNYVLDLVQRKLVSYLSGAIGIIAGGAFSPDGKLLVGSFRPYVGSDGPALWDGEGGIALHVWPRGEGWNPGVFAPDGKHLLANRWGDGPNLLSLTEVHSRKERWTIPAEHRAQAFTPDGNAVLVLRRTGLERVDLATGKVTIVWDGAMTDLALEHPTDCEFSPDRSQIAIAWGFCRGAGFGSIQIEMWDAATGKKLRLLAEVKEPD